MARVYKLVNTVQTYDWGSIRHIPELLGNAIVDGAPQAELWMGAHSNAPSKAVSDGFEAPLDELILRFPTEMLGESCLRTFGPRLPYLLKLLAAARPLSIQAHPDKTQAAEGWSRENAAGIPADSPRRNYKDDSHKPEIICAITPFRAMCGFRPVREIDAFLDIFDAPPLRSLRKALSSINEHDSLKAFFSGLNALGLEERRALGSYAPDRAVLLSRRDPINAPVWSLLAELSRLETEDPSFIAPLFLNCIDLRPGEAVFLPAGVLHSYVEGFGVELMANSDNVLRGGLTKKHVDVEELLRVLRFVPFAPTILKPQGAGPAGLRHYETEAAEFRLFEFDARLAPTRSPLPSSVPTIVVVIEGSFVVSEEGCGNLGLRKGESAFVPAEAPSATIEGTGLAYIASTPS